MIVDDANTLSEPDLFRMLCVFQPAHLVLLGDHHGMGPLTTCHKAAQAGLDTSAFSRLMEGAQSTHSLSSQHRMVSQLSRLA